MDLKIDPAALQVIVQQALLEKLTPEVREDLIKQALVQMLTPKKDPYSSSKQSSPFEDALQHASQVVCREIVKEELAKPEIRAQFSALVSKALAKSLDESNSVLVDNLAVIITKCIRERD